MVVIMLLLKEQAKVKQKDTCNSQKIFIHEETLYSKKEEMHISKGLSTKSLGNYSY